ncbi:MAG: hypothetical protein AABY30_05975, partial [Candidatus Thermoplasmatota archaeon]
MGKRASCSKPGESSGNASLRRRETAILLGGLPPVVLPSVPVELLLGLSELERLQPLEEFLRVLPL